MPEGWVITESEFPRIAVTTDRMVVYFDRGGFGGIIGRMYAGFKTLQHRLHHDRRPYGADDELL